MKFLELPWSENVLEFYKTAKDRNLINTPSYDQVIKPIYKKFPGWKSPTNGIKNIKDLPQNAKDYIYAIENFIGAKISSISTSPEREDTILLENPFEI